MTLMVLPGLDHRFQPVAPEAGERLWEQVSGLSWARPVSDVALGVVAEWAARTLAR